MTFQIDMSKVDTSYWRDHPKASRPDWLWPGYHCTLDKELQRDWGINCGQYFDIYDKQGGRCALCREKSERRFDIDHDYETGVIRGLLCRKCNRNLSNQIARYILNPPAAEFKLIVNSKRVKLRDRRLAEKRAETARLRANKKGPEGADVIASVTEINLGATAQEQLRRALESSR